MSPDDSPTGRPGGGRTPIAEIARLFLKLGISSFGGPAAHIALMEDEVVRRRAWLTRQEFLDYVGATNLIPGPNSTEVAIHIGHARAGWAGLVVAGLSFILPAVVIVALVARAYVAYGELPAVEGLLYGVKPVMIAIVAQALWALGRTAVKSVGLGVAGVAALGATAAGADELLVLGCTGAVVGVIRWRASRPVLGAVAVGTAGASMTAAATATAAAAQVEAVQLFLVFLKAGSVLFGSGYVLLAFLRADLVERLGWLTESQLLDAVAVGQVTPGPVFTTATFIGYLLGGPSGAALATIGIFLPAFVFVAASGPLVPRLRRSPTAAAVLDGVNVASLALMTLVSWQLGRAALIDPVTTAIAAASLLALVRFRVNSLWLILGGGMTGLLRLA